MFFISHFAVTSNPIIWRVVGHIHDFLIGASYHVWVYQVNCIARDGHGCFTQHQNKN